MCSNVSTLLENLPAVLLERCQLNPNGTIIVGVSGGPDSLCLMHVLHTLGYSIVVAHFNHRLRPEAEAEGRAVEAAAARLALPFVLGGADVRADANQRGISVEQAARERRYGFLFAEARGRSAQAVAVGHTADDQVETLLMHLIRGAGLRGLTGMAYRTVLPTFDPCIPVVRPLLGAWRDATVSYCAEHDLAAVYDSSNASTDYFRNRVRHDLLPVLESYNPRIREALWRTADGLVSDRALLDEYVGGLWRRAVVAETPDCVALRADSLAEASVTERKHLIRLSVQRLAPEQETPYTLLERAASFVAAKSGRREDLAGGMVIVREGDVLYVARGDHALPFDAWPQMPPEEDVVRVDVPGRVALASGWQLTSERLDLQDSGIRSSPEGTNLFRVRLDAERLPARLELRVRRRGDRFEPAGLSGHSRKVSDLFVDAKLPARARTRWPVLCDGDTIVWIPGFRPSSRYRLRDGSRHAISLEVARLVR